MADARLSKAPPARSVDVSRNVRRFICQNLLNRVHTEDHICAHPRGYWCFACLLDWLVNPLVNSLTGVSCPFSEPNASAEMRSYGNKKKASCYQFRTIGLI